MRVRFFVETEFTGSQFEEIVDLPDDSTDDQIQKDYECWLLNQANGSWERMQEPAKMQL